MIRPQDFVKGSRVYIRFEGYAMWHARIISEHIEDTGWICVTPDGDVYPEVLDANPDVSSIRLGVGNRQPYGLDPIHPFPCFRQAQMDEWQAEAARLAEGERRARGLDALPLVAVGGGPPGAAAAGTGGGGLVPGAPAALGAAGGAPGLPPPAVGGGGAAAAAAADAHRRWRLLERVGDMKVGDLIVPSANLQALEHRGMDVTNGPGGGSRRDYDGRVS